MVKTNPKKIAGRWSDGYSLDVHTESSEYLGDNQFGIAQFERRRSELGELVYRLKYNSDKSALAPIVETAAAFLAGWKDATGIELIIPVPPSKPRPFQPVLEIAKGLSAKLGIPCDHEAVKKVRETTELKTVYGYDERLKVLAGAHAIDGARVAGKTILLVDDLFRSGATMNAIAAQLLDEGKASKVLALTITRTRVNR